MHRPEHFALYELVPPDVYGRWSTWPARLWGMFDDRLLRTMDRLRRRYGPMVANTWHWGGNSQERGWRHEATSTGAEFSQHKYGRAVDLVPLRQGVTAELIRQDILADPFGSTFEHITCIELEVSWLHIDVRNHNKISQGVLQVRP